MIGYYVHHHGQGHLSRARCIAAALATPVTVFSSLPRPEELKPFAGWVSLPADDCDPAVDDVRAGGSLHWAPLRSPGYRRRMSELAAWAGRAQIRAFVVDVSVEVTAFVRLLGIPVVVMAGPGNRDDEVHQLGYRMAAHIVAPWPKAVYDPAHLLPYAEKLTNVGAISRFDGYGTASCPGGKNVLALFGGGGCEVGPRELADAQKATPAWKWRVFGGTMPWTGRVWDQLQAADVVITHAGQNIVAEVAAARRPAVLIAQRRPFEEQQATVAALAGAGLATGAHDWPQALAWPSILEAALARGGAGWARWNPGNGAAAAAAAITRVADNA